MKRHVILMPSILTFAILGVSSPATAQVPNFTITVPVELNDIHPDVQNITVQCQLFAAGRATSVGQIGPATITLDGTRSFSGPVRLEGDSQATSEAELLAINTYNCQTLFFTAEGGGVPLPDHDLFPLRPKPGTPFVRVVTGTIEPGG